MKSLRESLFDDDLVTKDVTVRGITIYMPDWELCLEYFKKRRRKYFGNKSAVVLGDLEYKYTIVYNEDDCLIAINDEEDSEFGQDVYILSPETIYINHETGIIGDGRDFVFSLHNIDDANDFDICFNWVPTSVMKWCWLCGCHSNVGRREVESELGVVRGYLPETISNRAKSIIKKYIK